jgi:WD40 repeat protein
VTSLLKLSNGLLATGSRDNTVKIWDLNTGECTSTLEGHKSYVSLLIKGADFLLTGTEPVDNTVKIWDLNTETCLQTWKNHYVCEGRTLIQLPCGRLVTTTEYGKQVTIVETRRFAPSS